MTGRPLNFYERVYAMVRRIPRGRVATYGQVAALLGVPRGARAVGWALRGIGARDARASPGTGSWATAAASRSTADRRVCSSAAACGSRACASCAAG